MHSENKSINTITENVLPSNSGMIVNLLIDMSTFQ